ncbi:SCY1-like protein 2 [Cimex lectularius]|uniref:Protein kinase domain-containing protein n=1 Tax=Cimex lectularius TaxID=79782 RepID=A0A8I6RLZ7_CIMLE|nr:SCY1-like protein 2 [Cimex lectularius]
MDVLNKFCSTVSSTVSQLSGVLPGNPVTREYEVTNHIGSAGPGLLWKIYSGYKKSTKQSASIFVFEKRQVVPQDRDVLLETLKRGIGQLTKLRHPQILVVQHPLEESRDCLAFATEPVFASLANILGKKDNMPQNIEAINNYKLYDVEIKYGLLQISEGLAFLHKDAKILHMNLCPSSIVINEQGAWKIFGFDFAILNSSSDATPMWKCPDPRSFRHELARPDLDYLAPECGLTESISPPSDIFSLGVLIFAIYNSGRTPFSNTDWHSYTANMSKLKLLQNGQLNNVAEGVRALVKIMLTSTPELRPDEHDFSKIDFFEDVGVKALNYLDSLFQWDNRQKSHFYKGLPQVLDKLPHRVCLYRVIPCLVKEFVNPMMVPFVLPSVFFIAENCSKQEFSTHILPHLITVMKIQNPIQILLIFMQKMDFLLKMTPCEEVKSHILPMLYRGFETDTQEIQELCLSNLPNFANLIEYPALKNAVLPRIKRLCISTSYISIRVNCLLCIGKLLDSLDKWLVMDEVLPFLPEIPSKEPAVLMGILGIYKLVLTNKKMMMSKEFMAQKAIPFLMPLAVENFLTLNQFNTIMSVIKDMVGRVEVEHKVKLEQLQEQQKTLESSMAVTSLSNNNADPPLPDLFSLRTDDKKSTPPPSQKPTLTLEEKQRIIAESEASKQLMSQVPLNLSVVTNNKPKPQPKDLTASLLDSNNFTLGTSKPQTFGLSNTTTQAFPTNTSLNNSFTMSSVSMPFTGNAKGNGFAGGFQSQNFSNLNSSSSLSQMTNNQMMSLNSNSFMKSPGNASQEWGSWNSNLQTPLLTPSSQAPSLRVQQAPKPLSNDDINDLLS